MRWTPSWSSANRRVFICGEYSKASPESHFFIVLFQSEWLLAKRWEDLGTIARVAPRNGCTEPAAPASACSRAVYHEAQRAPANSPLASIQLDQARTGWESLGSSCDGHEANKGNSGLTLTRGHKVILQRLTFRF